MSSNIGEANHMDNYLKEISACVYYGSIVNNRPKNVPPDNEDLNETTHQRRLIRVFVMREELLYSCPEKILIDCANAQADFNPL